MQVIHKYQLPIEPGAHIMNLPADFQVLTCAWQENHWSVNCAVLWAAFEMETGLRPTKVLAVFTGQPFERPANYTYIGTIHTPQGIVIHYFMEV